MEDNTLKINELLESYELLDKKTVREGYKIRRKLRKLGYYLSKQPKPEVQEEVTEDEV